MQTEHKVDLDRLEKGIRALRDVFAQLGKGDDLQELALIIRRPGWTTPAEMFFASGLVESMLGHAQALNQLRGVLLKGAAAVSTK